MMTYIVEKEGNSWKVTIEGFDGSPELAEKLVEEYVLQLLPDKLLLFKGKIICEQKGEYIECLIS